MAATSESWQFPQAVSWPAPEQTESWYALQTRVHRERVVEIRRWSDRKKKVEFPLFASYLFVRLSPRKVDHLRVLCVEGVFQFVGSRGHATPIPEQQIDAVRALINGGVKWSAHPFLKIGQRVRVRSGALAGIEGVLVSRTGESTLVISVDAIQRSMAVRIDGYDVEAA